MQTPLCVDEGRPLGTKDCCILSKIEEKPGMSSLKCCMRGFKDMYHGLGTVKRREEGKVEMVVGLEE